METLQETLKHLPHEPGVYLYHNSADTVIYVGKARDLFRRVHQYFQKDNAVGLKTEQLVSEIRRIEIIPVTSEFDALLLEAKLIRHYLPKYNVISRDDKSPLYIAFTLAEELPRVLFLRKRELFTVTTNAKNAVYGPFQSAQALRSLLRQIRGAVPYCTQKTRNGKPCFYTHLHLCNPCPSSIAGMEKSKQRPLIRAYRQNIFRLQAIFDGKTSSVRRSYESAMMRSAKKLRFEEAAMYKKRLDTLYRISEYRYDPAIFLERGASDVYQEELDALFAAITPLFPQLTSLHRIECFDMSQLFGKQPVGSMTVAMDGRPEHAEYRRFKIRSTGTVSDTAMMREVIERRLRHTDWPDPDFILIDGGKPQLSVVGEVMKATGRTINFAGLAKREEELIVPVKDGYKTVRLPLSGKAIKVLERIRDEAHRFAITYHRLLRAKGNGTM